MTSQAHRRPGAGRVEQGQGEFPKACLCWNRPGSSGSRGAKTCPPGEMAIQLLLNRSKYARGSGFKEDGH